MLIIAHANNPLIVLVKTHLCGPAHKSLATGVCRSCCLVQGATELVAEPVSKTLGAILAIATVFNCHGSH